MGIESNASLSRFARSTAGRAALVAIFAVGLAPAERLWLPITAGAAACAYGGKHRDRFLAVSTLAVVVLNPRWFASASVTLYSHGVAASPGDLDPAAAARWGALAAVLALAALAMKAVSRYPRSLLARRPVVSLMAVFAPTLLAVGHTAGTPRTWLCAFACTLAAYLWFIASALVDMRRARGGRPQDESPDSEHGPSLAFGIGSLHPLWGGSTVPIGTGTSFLREVESTNDVDLAVTQIKAVKLLAWSWVLRGLLLALRHFVHDSFGIPDLADLLSAHAQGHTAPALVGWASVVSHTLEELLDLSVWGHRAVACARLAGFQLPRNTWRPLSARTLVEYWNRYYHYFKELLVRLFFFPAALRLRRAPPNVRLALATFAAACGGNLLFHFVRDADAVAIIGVERALVGYQSAAFRAAVLSIGLFVSHLRSRNRPAARGWLTGQLLPSLQVWLMVCLLDVLDCGSRDVLLAARLSFVARLFGLGAP